MTDQRLDASSSAVIEHVKAVFGCQGIPEVVVSDNGPQFNSRVFMSFSERAVQMVKKLLKKADSP